MRNPTILSLSPSIQHASFDNDETISQKGKPSLTVVKGITHLQSLGIATTLATGRNLQSLHASLGTTYDQVVSERTQTGRENLVIVDGGGTIVRADGKGYHAFPLDQGTITALTDMLRPQADALTFMTFDPNPMEPGHPQVWLSPHFPADDPRRGLFAQAYTLIPGDFQQLALHLQTTTPSKIALGVRSDATLELTLPQGVVSAINRDVTDLLASDKAQALAVVRDALGLEYSEMLYGGDGWREIDGVLENDRPVLLIPTLGHRIIVSKDLVVGIPEPLTVVQDPDALGRHLLTTRRHA